MRRATQFWGATAVAQQSQSAEVRAAARAYALRQYHLPVIAGALCCPLARQGDTPRA